MQKYFRFLSTSADSVSISAALNIPPIIYVGVSNRNPIGGKRLVKSEVVIRI